MQELIGWVCKGNKEETERKFQELKEEIKDNYEDWTGEIIFDGNDDEFRIFIEYGSVKEEQKEDFAGIFTDLIMGLDVEILR